MTYQSSALVEHEFFTAFFSALRLRGCERVSWNGDSACRFLRVYDRLAEYASESDERARLARVIRPDHLTGVSHAFERALFDSPGIVGRYGGRQSFSLDVPLEVARETVAKAPVYIQTALEDAIAAFLD